MRTPRVLAVIVFLCIPCFSCDKRDRTHLGENKSVTAKHLSNESQLQGTSDASPGNSPETAEASMRKAFDSDSYRLGSNKVKAFRSALLELAKEKGKSPMSIAAPMILEGQSSDKQVKRMALVLAAFQDPTTQVDLAKQLPAGNIRSFVVSSFIGGFERDKDAAGFKLAYDSTPVGGDRNNIAVARSQMKIREDGLANGLEFIKQLEMPEERYMSIIATRVAWTSQIQNPETKSKLDQIVDTMDGSLKENLSLIISNVEE